MTATKYLEEGIDRKQLQKTCHRFQSLQGERLRRTEDSLLPNQRNYLKLLPLLFHVNHPALPGFVSSDTPSGVSDFTPTQKLLRIAHSINHSFVYQKRAHRRYYIQGIYLMGSMGSVAHSDKSDFDIWLCHDPTLNIEEQDALRTKANLLEIWGNELGLEIHFFVMDAESFRQGDRAAISHESCGSTQQNLLLEEFYRTGILVAGRYPIWWLVPPDQEANYDEYTHWLIEQRFVNQRDCLDFGGLEKIPPDEFFSAARWQLFKGIESPYKAVLKLLLIEAFSVDYPNIHWLCQETKKAVYNGCNDLAKLDPYICLYQRVERYLLERNELERLELARRCFYFKAEFPLSHKMDNEKKSWKAKLLHTLTQEWGWGEAELAVLDCRGSWKIDRVTAERNQLVKELSYSYRLLSSFARKHARELQTNQAELNLLGRKLYASLERRPGKIEHINPGISKNLVEERLSLHLVPQRKNESSWFLYRGDINTSDRDSHKPLKTSASLVEILTWCHINQVTDCNTHISTYPTTNSVTTIEIHALLDALRNVKHQEVPLAALATNVYTLSCILFVNIGQDPMQYLSRQGKQLTSNRYNPLSYGAAHSSLLVNLEQLIATSWGELLVVRHDGKYGLLDSICQYLQLIAQTPPGITVPKVFARGFSSIMASNIAKRIEGIYADLMQNFNSTGKGQESRYVLQIDDSYYLIQKNENDFFWIEANSMGDLLKELGSPLSYFRPITIDAQTLQDTPLHTIFSRNQAERIQVFFYTTKTYIDLYILDEQGALFYQKVHGANECHLLIQQQRFFEQHLRWRNLHSPNSQLIEFPDYYRLSADGEGGWQVADGDFSSGEISFNYLELHLVSESTDLRKDHYTLICQEQEFSTVEYSDQLFTAVAEQVQIWRTQNQKYPLYLTGVELSGPIAKQNNSTIKILHLKKHLETQLNQALVNLAVT